MPQSTTIHPGTGPTAARPTKVDQVPAGSGWMASLP